MLKSLKTDYRWEKNAQFTFGETGSIPKISFSAHKVPYVIALGSTFSLYIMYLDIH